MNSLLWCMILGRDLCWLYDLIQTAIFYHCLSQIKKTLLLRTLPFEMVCYLRTPALILLMSRGIPCIWRYLFDLLFIISHHKGKAKLSSRQRCYRKVFLFINLPIDLVSLFAVWQRDQLRMFTATLLVCELTSDTVLWPSTLH